MNVLSCDASVERCQNCLDMIGFGFSSFVAAKGQSIEEKVRRGLKLRILTMSQDCPHLEIRDRIEGDAPGHTKTTIRKLAEWVEKLRGLAPDPANVQIAYYDSLPLDFLFRTDDRLYVGPYEYGKPSQQSISYEFAAGGDGYRYYLDYFNRLWEEFSQLCAGM